MGNTKLIFVWDSHPSKTQGLINETCWLAKGDRHFTVHNANDFVHICYNEPFTCGHDRVLFPPRNILYEFRPVLRLLPSKNLIKKRCSFLLVVWATEGKGMGPLVKGFPQTRPVRGPCKRSSDLKAHPHQKGQVILHIDDPLYNCYCTSI